MKTRVVVMKDGRPVPSMRLKSATDTNLATDQNGQVSVDLKVGQKVPLDLLLRDENGQEVVLGDLLDKPIALSMVYLANLSTMENSDVICV